LRGAKGKKGETLGSRTHSPREKLSRLVQKEGKKRGSGVVFLKLSSSKEEMEGRKECRTKSTQIYGGEILV